MATEISKLKVNGFTLIEILVTMALFAVVVSISMGVIFRVLSVNQKIHSIASVTDSVSSGLETMSIDLRYGSDYGCEYSEGCDSIVFVNYDGVLTEYFLDDGQIWRSLNGGPPRRLIAPRANIDGLRFYVHDSFLVTIVIKGEVVIGRERSDFSLQTAVSQRQRHEDI